MTKNLTLKIADLLTELQEFVYFEENGEKIEYSRMFEYRENPKNYSKESFALFIGFHNHTGLKRMSASLTSIDGQIEKLYFEISNQARLTKKEIKETSKEIFKNNLWKYDVSSKKSRYFSYCEINYKIEKLKIKTINAADYPSIISYTNFGDNNSEDNKLAQEYLEGPIIKAKEYFISFLKEQIKKSK